MNIGTLEIQMAMDMARLRQDLAQTKDIVGSTMADVNRVIGVAKTAFVAFAGVASVGAFAGMINGAIEAQAGLHDLSKATGLSVAALGEFRKVGAYTETTTDAIASAALKLSKNLALTDEDGKGAALAIKALGLNFADFSRLNPEQRMLAAAKALDQYEDGADKSAAAMLLFGKEGAKMLPFLADLAEQSDEINGKLTDQEKATRAAAAAMADAYGDNLIKIRKESTGWQKDLAMGLLPAMYETTEAFLQVAGGAGGIRAKIGELAKDGTLAEWARGGVTALTYLLDVGHGLFSLFPMLGKAIAGVAAGSVQLFSGIGDALDKVMKGDFSGALTAMKGGFSAVAEIGKSTADDISAIWNQKLIGQSFRDSMDSLKGVQVEGKKTKDALDLVGVLNANEAAKLRDAAAAKAAAEAAKKQQAAYEAAGKAGLDLMQSLKLKNDQLQLEVDLGRQLTPVEQENLKLTRDLASGKVRLSQADEEAARAAIEHAAALEREAVWQQESHKSNLALIDSTDKRIEALRAETDKQREATAEIGLSADQLGALRQAKLLDLAASADRKAALLDEIDWTGQLGDQQRELAKAYRDSAAAAAEGAAVKAAKEAQDAWDKTAQSVGQGLTDSLYRALDAGGKAWDTLWSGIKNTVKTTALKVIIQGVDGKGGIAGAVLGGLGLGGSSAAMAGTGAGTGLGGLGGIGSALGGLFGSGGWINNFAGNVTGLAGDAGMWLMERGFDGLGGTLLGNAGTIGDLANGLGSGLGYLSAAKSLADGKYGAGILGGAGTFFGGPIGGALGNLVGGAIDKLFGGSSTHHSGAGYVSTGVGSGFGVRNGGDLGWSYGDSVNKYFNATIEDQLKVLTGGSAGMLNSLDKAFGGSGGFKVGGYFASDNRRESQAERSVWRDSRLISTWGGRGLDKDASVGMQQFTQALAGQVRDAMGSINLPEWARKQLDGLGAGATMEELANAVMAIEQTKAALQGFSDVLAPMGGVFGRVAGLSADAQMQLAGFAGGMDAFISKARSFVDNYYSTDEKNAILAAQIQKALSDAGVSTSLGSRDDFRAAVQGIDEQTEAGRKQLAVLLDLNAAFAPLGDYLKEQGTTLAELAAQAPQSELLQLMTDQQAAGQEAQLSATQTLNASVIGIGDQIASSISALGEVLQAALGAVQETVQTTARQTQDAFAQEGAR